MEEPENLPSHRCFFTSLVSSLSQGAAPPPPGQISHSARHAHDEAISEEEQNDDEVDGGDATAMDLNRRKLLLTLHVLFPSLLLPALDLLDRKLVTKVRLLRERPAPEDSGVSQDGPTGIDMVASPPLYVVRSVASTISTSKRRRPMEEQQQQQWNSTAGGVPCSYFVRLASWNCTCASFTFDSFPLATSSTRGGTSAAVKDDHEHGDQYGSPDVWWSGELSFDGMTEDTACCKHLLACLLIERRVASQEAYLQTRYVTKAELADLIAER